MHLNASEVAKLLNVTEDTIRWWIKEHHLPATFSGGEYHFDKNAILEWATASKLTLSSDLFSLTDDTDLPALSDALRTGGITYDVQADDKAGALAEIVRRLELPPGMDRQFLLSVLLAREAAASTAVGDGIAFPHVRNPIVLQVKRPMIALSFLATPIEYGAVDGKPVFALFTFVCPTVRIHLHLLSRLAFALRDRKFLGAVKRRAPADDILQLASETTDQLLLRIPHQKPRTG
jgi:PTS system nitrogen regulatory IIA component